LFPLIKQGGGRTGEGEAAVSQMSYYRRAQDQRPGALVSSLIWAASLGKRLSSLWFFHGWWLGCQGVRWVGRGGLEPRRARWEQDFGSSPFKTELEEEFGWCLDSACGHLGQVC